MRTALRRITAQAPSTGSAEMEWSVSRIMATLQDWNVRFYSYNEPPVVQHRFLHPVSGTAVCLARQAGGIR